MLEATRLGFTTGVNRTLAAIWEHPNGGITVNLWGSFVVRGDQEGDFDFREASYFVLETPEEGAGL